MKPSRRRSSASRWRTFARLLLGWAKSTRVRITTGRRAWLADATLEQVERDGARRVEVLRQLADTQPDEVAAILFTSGSTGVPKGVVYRHRHFVAQFELLREAFGIEADGVDLPTFPPSRCSIRRWALTLVIPDMDPTSRRSPIRASSTRRWRVSASTSCSARRR